MNKNENEKNMKLKILLGQSKDSEDELSIR